MKTAIISVTEGGRKTARFLEKNLSGRAIAPSEPLRLAVASLWKNYDALVFIMAAGIVVRTIAPLIEDKHIDPCVVVVDETCSFAISLLSGHLGGGNQLARKVAALLGAQPIITTASDCLGLTPLDLWARQNNLQLSSGSLTKLSAQQVNAQSLKIYSPHDLHGLPGDFDPVPAPNEADLVISNRLAAYPESKAVFQPKNLVVGIGCNRGTKTTHIKSCMLQVFEENKLAFQSIYKLASIDLKSNEQGLLDFAHSEKVEIDFFDKEQLNTVPGLKSSDTVFRATGAHGVSEPAALLGAGARNLLVRKTKCSKDVTIAIAERPIHLSDNYS